VRGVRNNMWASDSTVLVTWVASSDLEGSTIATGIHKEKRDWERKMKENKKQEKKEGEDRS